jgi:hypothetical protein
MALSFGGASVEKNGIKTSPPKTSSTQLVDLCLDHKTQFKIYGLNSHKTHFVA